MLRNKKKVGNWEKKWAVCLFQTQCWVIVIFQAGYYRLSEPNMGNITRLQISPDTQSRSGFVTFKKGDFCFQDLISFFPPLPFPAHTANSFIYNNAVCLHSIHEKLKMSWMNYKTTSFPDSVSQWHPCDLYSVLLSLRTDLWLHPVR